jgi:hypothetical protein
MHADFEQMEDGKRKTLAVLECGGCDTAFSSSGLHSKAAWRFASRRSPKPGGHSFARLANQSVFISVQPWLKFGNSVIALKAMVCNTN